MHLDTHQLEILGEWHVVDGVRLEGAMGASYVYRDRISRRVGKVTFVCLARLGGFCQAP